MLKYTCILNVYQSPSLQGRGRIEKTEIIEMAIKHMKHLQTHKYCTDDTNCEIAAAPNLEHEERVRQFRLGFQECLSEAVRFLVEIEGLFTGDGLCRRMMDHLHNHMASMNNGIDEGMGRNQYFSDKTNTLVAGPTL